MLLRLSQTPQCITKSAASAKTVLILVLGLLSGCYQALAQSAPSALSDQQAISMLKGSLATMSRSGKAPTSYMAQGTVTAFLGNASGTPFTVQIEVLGTDKFRWIENTSKGTVTTIINGTAGQTQSTAGRKPIASDKVYGYTSINLPVLALSQWLNTHGIWVRSARRESIAGQTLNHIMITGVSGRVIAPSPRSQMAGDRYDIYIDPNISLPSRIRYYQPVENKFVPYYLSAFTPVDIVFSDYRAVDGILCPFRITRYVEGKEVVSIQLQSVQLNFPINVNDFTID